MLHSSVEAIPLAALLKRKSDVTESERGEGGFRKIFVRCGVFNTRKGSAYIEIGSTKVVCTIDGPKEPSKGADVDCSEAVIDVKVSGMPDISHIVESTLRAVVVLEKLSKMQVDVEVTVLQDDGAALAAILMCSSLALCNAGIQTLDLCVAANVIISDGDELILDAPTSASTTSTIAQCKQKASITVALMPSLKQIICCELSGIATLQQYKTAIAMAAKSALRLWPLLRNAISSRS